MILTTRIQAKPEPSIEGNPFLLTQILASNLNYVIVLDGDQPVAQQSFYFRGKRWWVDDLFVAAAYRGTEVIEVLREATFRAVAERTDEFYSWIEHNVALPEKILTDPIKLGLGILIEEQSRVSSASKYRYDIRSLRTQAAGGRVSA
jgi:hypothetical protein